jgi:hypothetical protein
MRITTCASSTVECRKKKRQSVWSGASSVNDGALRYGPRRLLWLLHRHFFVKAQPMQSIFASTLEREV